MAHPKCVFDHAIEPVIIDNDCRMPILSYKQGKINKMF